jgi:hypothetical protein
MGSLFICYEAIDPFSLKNRVQSLMLLNPPGDANEQPIWIWSQRFPSQSICKFFIEQATIHIQNPAK